MALVVLIVVVGAMAWWHDRRRDQEWASGGADVHARAQVETVSADDYPDTLATDLTPVPTSVGAGQMYVVQVSWEGTPDAAGHYEFILLDDRHSPPEPIGAYAVWGSDGGAGPTWDRRMGTLAEHYPWLAHTAARQRTDGSYTDSAGALGLRATTSGDGTLTFVLARGGLLTSRPERDLLLAMVFRDDSGEVRWAKQVSLRS